MSENLDTVMEGIRVFEAEDWETFRDLTHEEARITGPEGWPEPGPFEGRDAVMGQLQRLTADWQEHRFNEIAVVAERDDWVVLRFQWEVRGAESGAPIATKMAAAYRLLDGRFVEAHFRWTPEEAFEAAGLSDPS
jgi:ketosteroid isomerase-like protein